MNQVEFGMKVLKYTQTSFERQIRESVVIQAERTKHKILNSRSEYNRCSLPRLCTQVGDGAFKEYESEIQKEKLEDEKIEYKIRQLRKERNRARLHPTREQQPSKRRKIVENEYITIKEVWGEPEKSTQTKNKAENTESTQPEKKTKKSPGEQVVLTNVKRIENKVYQGPACYDMEYMPDLDWDRVIREHREQLEREQTEYNNRMKGKDDREQSWELNRLCRKYLEENDKKWAERKVKREQELARTLRLEKTGIKGRQAKLAEIRKNIEKGMNMLPEVEKEKIEKEENKKRKLELQAIKKDLWTLKRYEKKDIETEYMKRIREIKELSEKAMKIKEILADLKLRKEKEKEMKERELARRTQYWKEKKSKEQKAREKEKEREEKLRKEKEIHEKRALLRWTTEYIEKNSERWEKEALERENEKKRELLEWERKNRFEKIRFLKEKLRLKENGNQETQKPQIKEKPQSTERIWKVWREKKPNVEEKKEITPFPQEKCEQPTLPQLIIKLNQPKIPETIHPPPQTIAPVEQKKETHCQKPTTRKKTTSIFKKIRKAQKEFKKENRKDKKIPETKPTTETQEIAKEIKKLAPIFQNPSDRIVTKVNNQKKPEKLRTSIAGSHSAKKNKNEKPEPNQNMIKNMQKFWRDYQVRNLVPQNDSVVPQNDSGGVGGDDKVKPPDNNGSTAPVSEEQRIWSRKDLARDGSTSIGRKAKILAHNSFNTDKTRRVSEDSESIIPCEGR